MSHKPKIGGIPTLSGISGISGLGTRSASQPPPPSLSPPLSSHQDAIIEHLKSISIGVNNISTHLSSSRPLVQVLDQLDQQLGDNDVIIICKNPVKRDDLARNASALYESFTDAAHHLSKQPDVKNIISNI